MWEPYKKGFKAYLQLERSLSDNSVVAYLSDLEKFTQFLLNNDLKKSPAEIDLSILQQFIKWIAELGMTQASQARMISALRTFVLLRRTGIVRRYDPAESEVFLL